MNQQTVWKKRKKMIEFGFLTWTEIHHCGAVWSAAEQTVWSYTLPQSSMSCCVKTSDAGSFCSFQKQVRLHVL